MTAPASSGPSLAGGGPVSLPPWEETTREAAAWDRAWFDRDDDED